MRPCVCAILPKDTHLFAKLGGKSLSCVVQKTNQQGTVIGVEMPVCAKDVGQRSFIRFTHISVPAFLGIAVSTQNIEVGITDLGIITDQFKELLKLLNLIIGYRCFCLIRINQ